MLLVPQSQRADVMHRLRQSCKLATLHQQAATEPDPRSASSAQRARLDDGGDLHLQHIWSGVHTPTERDTFGASV
jgi:hypothetical protein